MGGVGGSVTISSMIEAFKPKMSSSNEVTKLSMVVEGSVVSVEAPLVEVPVLSVP